MVCWLKGKLKCTNSNDLDIWPCNTTRNQLANYAHRVEEETNVFYVCNVTSVKKKKDIWYIDSGCINHMIAITKKWEMGNIDGRFSGKVKIVVAYLHWWKVQWQCENGQLVEAIGKGTLVVETRRGKRFNKEVMLVPGLDENLLNVCQMIIHGYFLLFGDNMVQMFGDRSL